MGSRRPRRPASPRLHQLMAIDLRFVAGRSRAINNDLRAHSADQAVNIAQGVPLPRPPAIRALKNLTSIFPRMSELVEEMVRNALNGRSVRRDRRTRRKASSPPTIRWDHYRGPDFSVNLLTYMMGDSQPWSFLAFELILVAKKTSRRIGDHATKHRPKTSIYPRPGPGHPPQHRRPPLGPALLGRVESWKSWST